MSALAAFQEVCTLLRLFYDAEGSTSLIYMLGGRGGGIRTSKPECILLPT